MEVIKNGKTVCRADASNRIVEIVQRGFKTVIQFMEDGTMKVLTLRQFKTCDQAIIRNNPQSC